MSDAHQSVRHLLRQLDQRRTDPGRGFRLPHWLESFIAQMAEHFEPETEAARAGYSCTCTRDGWEVTLFLGTIEVVGGPEDGANIPIGFRFDVDRVRRHFDHVERIHWMALPAGCEANRTGVDESVLDVEGTLHGQRLRLQVSVRPPADVGPGLLRQAGGRISCTE